MVKLAESRLASLPIAEYLIERSEFERQRFAFTTLVQPNLDFLHYDHAFAATHSLGASS